MPETMPERIERIRRDHNISFTQAVRVALAERRFEKAREQKERDQK